MNLKVLADLPNHVAIVEAAAQAAHERNREYCLSIGDESQSSWEDAPQWQRDSAISGVLYLIDHPDATPAQQHAAWSRVKINDGWVYGKVKDEKRKTHPCLVEYEDLPEVQRVKDEIFQAAVLASLSKHLPKPEVETKPHATEEQGVSPHLDAPGALANPAAGEDSIAAAAAVGKHRTVLVSKYGDRIAVQLKDSEHLAALIEEHGAANVKELP